MRNLEEWFYWVLSKLVLENPRRPEVVYLSPVEARLLYPNGKLVAILVDSHFTNPNARAEWVTNLAQAGGGAIEILVISDDPQVKELLGKQDKSFLFRNKNSFFHLDSAGDSWSSPNSAKKSEVGRALATTKEPLAAIPADEIRQRLAVLVAEDRRSLQEIANFQDQFQGKNNVVTMGVLGSFIILYGFAELWGGATYIPTLMRMGANASDAVHQGEWWRLFTSIFLHAGFLHIFFNGYVLVALGSFFNRLFGSPQFIVLFMLSGVFGSLASVMVGHADVSVGGSGALWGLFGASAAIVLRPSHILPEQFRLRMRRVVLINLVLNLSISFLPMVDIWAHLGGGITGFLLGFAFVKIGPKNDWFENGLKVASVALIALVFVSFWLTLSRGQPWKLVEEPVFVKHAFRDLVIEIPEILKVAKPEPEGIQVHDQVAAFGTLPMDPMTVSLGRSKINNPPKTEMEKHDLLLLEIRGVFERENVKMSSAPAIEHGPGFTTMHGSLRKPGQPSMDIWVQLRGNQLIELGALAMPDTPAPLLKGLERSAKSILILAR